MSISRAYLDSWTIGLGVDYTELFIILYSTS